MRFPILKTDNCGRTFQVNHLHNQTEPVPRRMRATLTETKPMLFYANYQATAYLIINTTE